MGSKTKIADSILAKLPSGKRFVDLFGGGFAMSHAALLSDKFEQIYYGDFNSGITHLVEDAYKGKYNYSRFQPEFITRERFYAEKDSDYYIRYIWSFGNKGDNYMFGRDVEPMKHIAHDFVVFGKYDPKLEQIAKGVSSAVTSKGIRKRRLEFCGYVKKQKSRFDLQQLEQLERLQFGHGCSYLDYEYHDGDVVYCDPPYVGTAEYIDKFDYEKFFNWASSQKYDIYFSNYPLYDDRFELIFATQLRSSLGAGNKAVQFECLYKNRLGDNNGN